MPCGRRDSLFDHRWHLTLNEGNAMNRASTLALVLLAFSGTAPAKDLVGVFEDAVHNDPVIRQADANRLAAREARPQAWAAVLPQLNGTAGASGDHNAGEQPFFCTGPNGTPLVTSAPAVLDTTTKTWAVNLRQNLFSWSNWMALKAAGREVAQAEATYQAAEQQLILRVAQAYFNVLAAEDGLEAQQASLDAIARQLDQTVKRYNVGLIAITDVQEAKAARDTAAAAVIAAKRTLATSEDQLQEITGQKYDRLSKPGGDMPLKSPEPADETRWVNISLEQNLSLIFSGGFTQSKVRQTQYLWIAAKEAVVQSSRATERQARDAYLGVISGIARVQALRQALESSQTALKATEAGYEVGTRTAVDVLNSRKTLVQAKTDYSGSRYDYIVSVLQLRLAAGNLDRPQLTEINGYLTVAAPTSPPVTPENLAPTVPSTPA